MCRPSRNRDSPTSRCSCGRACWPRPASTNRSRRRSTASSTPCSSCRMCASASQCSAATSAAARPKPSPASSRMRLTRGPAPSSRACARNDIVVRAQQMSNRRSPFRMSAYRFVLQLSIPAELEDKFNTIYDTDHLTHMIRIPGVTSCTRFKLEWSDTADMLEYLAIYEIDDPELPRSDIWKKHAAMGRWATDMRPHVTLRRSGVYRQIAHHTPP